jgi:hypothetical protein
MIAFKSGQRVYIERGTYKGRSAVYLGKVGSYMCRVRLQDGERRIWLSSIAAIDNTNNDDNAGSGGDGSDDLMRSMQQDIKELRKEMHEIKLLLARLVIQR